MDEDSNMDEEPNRLLIDESVVSSSAPASPPTSSSQLQLPNNAKMAATGTKTTRKGHRITEYIQDKSLRMKSYFRRRCVPFKRAFDMDLQCGTQSLLIQISDDIEECLYYGHDRLVQKFLSLEGINFVQVDAIILEEKRKLGRFAAEDPEILEALGKKRRKSAVKSFDEDDDEFSPTVKEKVRREREKRKEAAKRVQEGDYLSNLNERTKAFKSRKDLLINKVKDSDEVCGTKSFLVIVNMDHEAAYYHGDPHLVTQFFTNGVSKRHLNSNYNVRAFEPEEQDLSACSVPHCLVTKNTLSSWRRAAVKMYKFPKSLPMTLHLCPEADRERWLAELDIDPSKTSVTKLAVCSLHFREGLPTDKYPLPTELLSDKVNTKLEFKGTRPAQSEHDSEDTSPEEDLEDLKFTRLASKKSKKPIKERMKMAVKARRLRRQWIPAVDFTDKKSMRIRNKKIFHNGLFGSRIQCRFCRAKFLGTKQYFQHVKKFHLPSISKSDLIKVAQECEQQILPVSSKKKTKPPPVIVTPEEKAALLSMMYPKNRTKPMNPRKKYVCAVCKSPCDLYGLFFHMKQVHQGLLCCYCTKLFKKVSDLEAHIKNVHRVPKRYYHNSKQFSSVSGSKYHLVCSICSDIISVKEIDHHACKISAKKQFDCPNSCGRVFPGQAQLEVHLCNGWCKEMHWLNTPALEDRRKLYKVLTGKDSDPAIFQDTPQKAVAPVQQPQKQQEKKLQFFNVHDKRIYDKFNNKKQTNETVKKEHTTDSVIENCPWTGSIFHSFKARGLSASLKKELRENGTQWRGATSANNDEEGEKFDTFKAELHENVEIIKLDNNFCINHQEIPEDEPETKPFPLSSSPQRVAITQQRKPNRRFGPKLPMTPKEAMENKENNHEEGLSSLKISIPIKKESKSERISRASKDIPANFERLRGLLDHFASGCLFCQQAQMIQVEAIFLLSHLLILHDRQIVKQFLNEDAQDSIFRIKNYMKDTKIREVIFSYQSSATTNTEDLTKKFKCCYCSDQNANSYDALLQHLKRQHKKEILTCHLCTNVFLNYGSFLSHVCFGPPNQNCQVRAKFSCMYCYKPDLSTFLDFQKHVRQVHDTCEICLHHSQDQATLHQHCLVHSQEQMCMKCFLTYENHQQFRKHLFYKHEEEHQLCSECHQKTWPHVYHFCIEPPITTCELCDTTFDSFRKYRVHFRSHTGATPYACSIRGCKKSYVSKQLLLKHQIRRHPELRTNAATELESRRNKKYLNKMGATSMDHIQLCQDILVDLIKDTIKEPPEETSMDQNNLENNEKPNEEETNNDDNVHDESMEEFDPIASAVASIMGPDGNFDIRKSPVKPVVPTPMPTPTPTPIPMPRLIPVNGQPTPPPPTKSNPKTISLLKEFRKPPKPVDPLKEMLEKKNTLPEPSDILPPSSIKDIVKGTADEKSDESLINPVLGGIWNQDLLFVSNADKSPDDPIENSESPKKAKTAGCKIMKPRYAVEDSKKKMGLKTNMPGLKTLQPTKGLKTLQPKTSWEVCLSESSGSDNEEGPKKPKIFEKSVVDLTTAIKDHDYCHAAFVMSKELPKKEDLSEMDKILSNVALGAMDNDVSPKTSKKHKRKKESKKKKKKRKKHKKNKDEKDSSSSSDSEVDVDVTTQDSPNKKVPKKRLHKPKYHTPGTSQGVTASAARPRFSSSEGEEEGYLTSGGELASSDLDTDFSADEIKNNIKRTAKPTPKAAAFAETEHILSNATKDENDSYDPLDTPTTPSLSLKLKIKLPQQKQQQKQQQQQQPNPKAKKVEKAKKKVQKRKRNEKHKDKGRLSSTAPVMSKKMRESLALNRASSSSDSSDYDSDHVASTGINHVVTSTAATAVTDQKYHYVTNNGVITSVTPGTIDNRLYCVCQSPHDDVSEMIGCDAPDCRLEWFHFECVGIMVPPEGQWYCPECTKRYNIRATY